MGFQQKLGAGAFGGDGFRLQKIGGQGRVWCELSGEIVTYDLRPGEEIKVHPGHVGLFQDTVQFNITTVKGIKNKIFGGDGIFLAQLIGPGRVWLQSLPLARLAHALGEYSVVQGAEAGAAGGVVGGLLREHRRLSRRLGVSPRRAAGPAATTRRARSRRVDVVEPRAALDGALVELLDVLVRGDVAAQRLVRRWRRRLVLVEQAALDELLAGQHRRRDEVVDRVGVVHLGVEHGDGVAPVGTGRAAPADRLDVVAEARRAARCPAEASRATTR